MKLYKYESIRNIGRWHTKLSEAEKEYEEEKEWLMSNEPDEDDWVKLITIEVPNDFIEELEAEQEENGEIKQAILIYDPRRIDENPRQEGYDYDFYAIWSDDLREGEE